MAVTLTSKIQKISLYFMSVVMGLGTYNPFQKFDPYEEPVSFLIYPALSFIILAYFIDLKLVRKRFAYFRKCEVSLILLWATILISGFIYYATHAASEQMDYAYMIKMLFSFLSFYLMACLLVKTKDIFANLLIYSVTCVIIILPFLLNIGSYSDYYHFSGGRLLMYGENPNTFSGRLAIAVIFFCYSITSRKTNLIYKVFCVTAILALLYLIMLSGSRGSFAIVLLCGLILFMRRLSIIQFVALLVPCVVVLIYVVLNNISEFSIFDRFEYLQDKGDLRSVLMAYAINIWESFPIFGCGHTGYLTEKLLRFDQPLDSHCIVTSIMAMGGVFGLFWFLRFIWLNFISTWKIRKQSILPMIIFLFMFFLSLKTGGIITYFMMYYTYAIVAAESYLVSRQVVNRKIKRDITIAI